MDAIDRLIWAMEYTDRLEEVRRTGGDVLGITLVVDGKPTTFGAMTAEQHEWVAESVGLLAMAYEGMAVSEQLSAGSDGGSPLDIDVTVRGEPKRYGELTSPDLRYLAEAMELGAQLTLLVG